MNRDVIVAELRGRRDELESLELRWMARQVSDAAFRRSHERLTGKIAELEAVLRSPENVRWSH